MIHETRRGRRRRGRALRADGGSRPALLDVGTPGRAPACPGAKPPQSAGLNLTCPPRRLVDRRSRARAAEDAGWRRREVPSRAIARRRRRPARLARAPRAAISPRAWRRCAFASRRGRWISRGRTGASPTETTRARRPGCARCTASTASSRRRWTRRTRAPPCEASPPRRPPPPPRVEARATRVDSPPPSRTPRDSARTSPRTPSASDPGPPSPSPPPDPKAATTTTTTSWTPPRSSFPPASNPIARPNPPREPYPRGTRAATSTTRWPPRPRNRNHARHPRARTQSRPRRPPNRRN